MGQQWPRPAPPGRPSGIPTQGTLQRGDVNFPGRGHHLLQGEHTRTELTYRLELGPVPTSPPSLHRNPQVGKAKQSAPVLTQSYQPELPGQTEWE